MFRQKFLVIETLASLAAASEYATFVSKIREKLQLQQTGIRKSLETCSKLLPA